MKRCARCSRVRDLLYSWGSIRSVGVWKLYCRDCLLEMLVQANVIIQVVNT